MSLRPREGGPFSIVEVNSDAPIRMASSGEPLADGGTFERAWTGQLANPETRENYEEEFSLRFSDRIDDETMVTPIPAALVLFLSAIGGLGIVARVKQPPSPSA